MSAEKKKGLFEKTYNLITNLEQEIRDLKKENLELKEKLKSRENQGHFSATWMQDNLKNVVQEKGEVSISLGKIINPEELKKQKMTIEIMEE